MPVTTSNLQKANQTFTQTRASNAKRGKTLMRHCTKARTNAQSFSH